MIEKHGAGDDLEPLPGLYAAALRLARAGTPPLRIAEALEIPVESVAGLLILAEAKLTALSQTEVPRPRGDAE